MNFKYPSNKVLKSYDMVKRKENGAKEYNRFAIQSLRMTKMVRSEVKSCEKQKKVFEELYGSFKDDNGIDPRIKLYRTNKYRDVYNLNMNFDNDDDDKYTGHQQFEEMFNDKDNKYEYYKGNNKKKNMNNGVFRIKKKKREMVNVKEFYGKIRSIKERGKLMKRNNGFNMFNRNYNTEIYKSQSNLILPSITENFCKENESKNLHSSLTSENHINNKHYYDYSKKTMHIIKPKNLKRHYKLSELLLYN